MSDITAVFMGHLSADVSGRRVCFQPEAAVCERPLTAKSCRLPSSFMAKVQALIFSAKKNITCQLG